MFFDQEGFKVCRQCDPNRIYSSGPEYTSARIHPSERELPDGPSVGFYQVQGSGELQRACGPAGHVKASMQARRNVFHRGALCLRIEILREQPRIPH